ncbi:MAG: hypothetical protein IPM61_05245 [Chlorobi bacterium]|nr:hypothetical protein [Chlorobiota bacterium]MBX7217279.1 hypothetical protein [Candidatus Kapabacteria bacterium]
MNNCSSRLLAWIRLADAAGTPAASRMVARLFAVAVAIIATGAALHAQPIDTTGRPSGATPLPSIDTLWVPDWLHLEGLDSTEQWLFQHKIRPLVRLREDLRRDTAALRAFLDSLRNTPEAIRRRNLAILPEQWTPTQADRARREQEIRQSQDWDFIHPQGITYLNVASIPLSDIATMMGVTEDVSPVINYLLPEPGHVSVMVYNTSAQHIATIVDAPQKSGSYRYEWNMLDAQGVRAKSGDYFAEVRSGREKKLIARKRIVVP